MISAPALILGLVVAASPSEEVLSPSLLGSPSTYVGRHFAGCSPSSMGGDAVQMCRFDVAGQIADVTFQFDTLSKLVSIAVTYPATLSAEAASALYNRVCPHLRAAFQKFREQSDATTTRRLFFTPGRALALAEVTPTGVSGAQITVTVRTVPVASAAARENLGLSLDKFDLKKAGLDLSSSVPILSP